MRRDSVEKIHDGLCRLTASAEPPDLGLGRRRVSNDVVEMCEQETRCFHEVVAPVVRDNECQVGLSQHGKLARLLEHRRVGCHETLPRAMMVVEREENLPVLHVREPRIDCPDRDELDIAQERRNGVDEGLREVLIEREEPRHRSLRRRSSGFV